MDMDDRTKQVLERVAEGVWNSRETSIGTFRQCSFCGVAPDNRHYTHCPVKLSKEILEEGWIK